jgi:hypothetical protein
MVPSLRVFNIVSNFFMNSLHIYDPYGILMEGLIYYNSFVDSRHKYKRTPISIERVVLIRIAAIFSFKTRNFFILTRGRLDCFERTPRHDI